MIANIVGLQKANSFISCCLWFGQLRYYIKIHYFLKRIFYFSKFDLKKSINSCFCLILIFWISNFSFCMRRFSSALSFLSSILSLCCLSLASLDCRNDSNTSSLADFLLTDSVEHKIDPLTGSVQK